MSKKGINNNAVPIRQALLVFNQYITSRLDYMRGLNDTKRDLDAQCRYPENIEPQDFKRMFDREGVGRRVNTIWPDECWAMTPDVYEQEDPELTAFEEAWYALCEEQNIFHYLHRLDLRAGIGHFGIALLGFDDLKAGQDLSTPVEGITDDEQPAKKVGRKLNFIRVYDETCVTVDSIETNVASPRLGMPTMYNVQFADVSGAALQSTEAMKVHWTRVLHFADDVQSCEWYGTPRMEPVWNYLLNIRKIAGGSAEMYWRNAAPSYSVETTEGFNKAGGEIDSDDMKEQVDAFTNTLKRWILLENLSLKSHAPSIVSPRDHMDIQLELIAITICVPKRKLMGSEQGELASGQDSKSWNGRVTGRCERLLTPKLIRVLVRRLQAAGVLPPTVELHVEWPDLNAPSEDEKVSNIQKLTAAICQYASSGASSLIPPLEFMTMVLDWPIDKVQSIIDAALQEMQQAEEDAALAAQNDPNAVDVNGDPIDPNMNPNDQKGAK